jgi:hypothetical protein
VSILLTLLVVVCFCDHEDPTELIFESVDSLWGDHTVEACQFVAEGDQRVVGCIDALCLEDAIFVLLPLLLEHFGCEKAS